MNLHAKLKDAILELDERNITAIFLYRWPYTRIQKLFDHQDRLVFVVFILCEQTGTQVYCIFRACVLILSHHVDNCKFIGGFVVSVANVSRDSQEIANSHTCIRVAGCLRHNG